MRRDRNYVQAEKQMGERLSEAMGLLADATRYMQEDRPWDALDVLSNAKNAIEGAMISVKWATTLPNPED